MENKELKQYTKYLLVYFAISIALIGILYYFGLVDLSK
jgi:hypothetical protein